MNVLPEVIGGKYKVVAQIGRGGMATVYSAVHLGTDRRVAVKVMTTAEIDPDSSSSADRNGSLARFEREARIAGNVETQHVTRVYDTGIDPVHGPFIVMELLTGEDVKDLVRRLGPLRPDLALRIVGQACVGIARAHTLGVVHRDVKASNLFLAQDEFGKIVVKVLDFGIAKGRRAERIDASDPKTLTKTGAMLGSPHYMSPEQVLGTKALDHRADIWSLGIVLYKCLSARTPFDDRDTVGHIIVSIVQGSPPSVQDFAPWVSPEAAAVINRALKSRPQDRFQSAQEMYEAIKAIVPGEDLEITPEMLTPMTDDERRDVKPRLSTRVTIPDGMPGAGLLAQSAKAAANAAGWRHLVEGDSTIGSATSSSRQPSIQPRSLRSKIVAAVLVLAVGGAVVWGVTHRSHDESPPLAAASATPVPVTETAAAPATTGSAPVDRHVEVRILPPNASVEVDDAAAVVQNGAIDVVGELGSVHKVHLRSAGREATVEVIVTEDGARPHVVGLPDPRSAGASGKGTGVRTAPAPTPAPQSTQKPKSTTRFETQFE
jgi:serine/threonine-protein kinase